MKPRIRFNNGVPVEPSTNDFDISKCYCLWFNAQEKDYRKRKIFLGDLWITSPRKGTTLRAH